MLRPQKKVIAGLILPAAALLGLFQVVPIIIGARLSFTNYTLYEPQAIFVGFKNYWSILADSHFYSVVLPNTFVFMAGSVLTSLLLGLGTALLLNRAKFRGIDVVKTLLILPLMIAPVVAATMIAWIFHFQFGVMNMILHALGFEPVAWLMNKNIGLALMISADVWTWTPFFTILIFAALQSMPSEPFDAAKVDGAGPWKAFRYVTLPFLRPVVVVMVVVRAIDAYRAFDVVWTLTAGKPARQTEIFSFYAYKEAIVFFNYGKGMAASLLGALIIIPVGVVLYFGFRYATRV